MTRSGASRFGFGRRLVGWIAAYAFVLHAVLAGAVATQLAATAGFELCVAGPAGPDGTPVGHGQSRHESCAIHCAAVGAVPLLALALLGLLFPPRAASRVPGFAFRPVAAFPPRAGRSRAPPLPA